MIFKPSSIGYVDSSERDSVSAGVSCDTGSTGVSSVAVEESIASSSGPKTDVSSSPAIDAITSGIDSLVSGLFSLFM